MVLDGLGKSEPPSLVYEPSMLCDIAKSLACSTQSSHSSGELREESELDELLVSSKTNCVPRYLWSVADQ